MLFQKNDQLIWKFGCAHVASPIFSSPPFWSMFDSQFLDKKKTKKKKTSGGWQQFCSLVRKWQKENRSRLLPLPQFHGCAVKSGCFDATKGFVVVCATRLAQDVSPKRDALKSNNYMFMPERKINVRMQPPGCNAARWLFLVTGTSVMIGYSKEQMRSMWFFINVEWKMWTVGILKKQEGVFSVFRWKM